MYKATAKTSKESCLNLFGENILKKGKKKKKRNMYMHLCLRNKHLLATYFNSTQIICQRMPCIYCK